MPLFRMPSTPVVSSKPVLFRLAQTLALMLALASQSWGQSPPSNPPPATKKIHWHKYVNKEFGFSLWYPDTYWPNANSEYCNSDNDYRRWLLCLERRDDPETTITVSIFIKGPFVIPTNRGGIEYTRQKIGQHFFYCGLAGSQAVGLSDECTFNLKGKTLEFSFSPAETPNSGKQINPLMFESLQTFRTF